MRTAAFNLRFAPTLRRAIRCRMRHCISAAARRRTVTRSGQQAGRDCILRRHTVLATNSVDLYPQRGAQLAHAVDAHARELAARDALDRARAVVLLAVRDELHVPGSSRSGHPFLRRRLPTGWRRVDSGQAVEETAREVVVDVDVLDRARAVRVDLRAGRGRGRARNSRAAGAWTVKRGGGRGKALATRRAVVAVSLSDAAPR